MELVDLANRVFPHVPERKGLEAANWRPIIDQIEWNYTYYKSLERLDRTCVTGVLEREKFTRPSTYGPQWLGPIDIVTTSFRRATDLAAVVGAVTEWESGSVHETDLPAWKGAPADQMNWSLVVPVEELTSDLVVEALRRFEIRYRQAEERRIAEIEERRRARIASRSSTSAAARIL